MKLLCVIGDPVGHSLSPAMHNAALEHLGLGNEFSFEKLNVAPTELAAFMENVRKGKFVGLSVTMPHKIFIIPYLDSLSGEASLIGAVNTITLNGGKLVGHNTDGAGCVRALEAAGIPIKGKTIVLLGAGGAARAIAVSLALGGAGKLIILNRTQTAAEAIAATVREVSGTVVETVGLDSMAEVLETAGILINATPVGMGSSRPRTIVPKELLRRNMDLFDIVYEPAETRLLMDGREMGARTIPGTEMLLHQGALQFKLFTGMEAPIEVMRAALTEAR